MALQKQDRKAFYALMFPALIETVISRVFVIADSVMIGQMENSTASVAAVGICNSPINLIISASNAFFIGTTATVAWYFGSGEKRRMRSVAWQSMGLSLIIALVLSAASLIFAGPIMRFICGDGEMLSLATSYYQINALGFFFQIVTLNISAILRGIGISKISMVYNLTGGAVNVVLNYALIYGAFGLPELRSDGAAYATVIAKLVSFVFALLVLFFKKTEIDFRLGFDKKIDSAVKNRLLPIGLTAMGEQIILQSGAVISSKILSTLKTAQVASYNIVSTVEGFAWATGSACQTASTSLFGRSLGEHNEKKARSFLSLAVRWAIGFALVEFALFCIFGRQIAMMFTNDSSLYTMVAILLVLAAFELPFINTHQTVSGALRGAGDSVAPLIASFISLWVFRVLLGFILVNVLHFGVYAYKGTLIADQLVRCTIVSIFYLTGHWKRFVYKKR